MCLRNIVRIRVWGARWGDDRLLDLTSGVLAQQPVPTELVAQDWHWKAHSRDAVPLEQVAYFHLRSVWLWQLSLSLSLSLSHSLTHTHTHTHTQTQTLADGAHATFFYECQLNRSHVTTLALVLFVKNWRLCCKYQYAKNFFSQV